MASEVLVHPGEEGMNKQEEKVGEEKWPKQCIHM
jgi:hypothetical protein